MGGNCHFSLDKNKYLVGKDLTMGRFIHEVRKHITSWPNHDFASKAIFFFCSNTLVPAHIMLGTIYDKYKDDCGFLNFTISEESTFGGMTDKDINQYRESKFGYEILKRYPDRIPIIVQNNTDFESFKLNKFKFLCPDDVTMGKFIHELKKHITYDDNRNSENLSFFFMCKNNILINSFLVSQIYEKYKDEESGCLFIYIYEESVFG